MTEREGLLRLIRLLADLAPDYVGWAQDAQWKLRSLAADLRAEKPDSRFYHLCGHCGYTTVGPAGCTHEEPCGCATVGPAQESEPIEFGQIWSRRAGVVPGPDADGASYDVKRVAVTSVGNGDVTYAWDVDGSTHRVKEAAFRSRYCRED